MEKNTPSIFNKIKSGCDKLYRFVNIETPNNETNCEGILWGGGILVGWLIFLNTANKAYSAIYSIKNSNPDLGYFLSVLYVFNTLMPIGLMMTGKYTGRVLDKKIFPKIGNVYSKIRDAFNTPDLRNLEAPLYKT